MNKKGFTLIELLAVIIIISVIALITVSIVVNVIDSSKRKALQNSAHGLIEAAQLYYGNSLLKPDEYSKRSFEGPDYTGLDFKGKKYIGKVTFVDDDNIAVAIYDNGWCAYKGNNEDEVSLAKISQDECIQN